MLNLFLSFTDYHHSQAYNIQQKVYNQAIKKGAFIHAMIFNAIEIIIHFSIYVDTKTQIDIFDSLYNSFYIIIIFCLCMILGYILCTWIKNRQVKNRIQEVRNEFLSMIFLTGISYTEFAFGLLGMSYNDLIIMQAAWSSIMALWKIFIGFQLLSTALGKFVYVLEIIGFLLIKYSTFYPKEKSSIICCIILIEFMFFASTAYYKERTKRLIFIQKYQESESRNTLEFILNEIAENILILDEHLNPKFVSQSLGTINIKEFFSNIKSLKRRKNRINPVIQTDVLSIDVPNSERNDNSGYVTRSQIYKALYKEMEKVNEQKSLYEICIGDDCDAPLCQVLENSKGDYCNSFIFDCKFINPRTLGSKSIELKVCLAQFNKEKCLIFIFRDTTERDTIVKLEDNNEYKERLLASVTHELRTPLNGNLTLLECAIQDETISKDVKGKFLLPALRSGKLLMNIINDILDFSQIDADKLKLNFEKLNIRQTLKECISLVKLQAEKKNLSLKIDISKDVPINFCTDHKRLSQITLNLLTNALKFTFDGGINIEAGMIGNALEISVKDTGIGIKQEYINDLFKPLTKVENNQRFQMNCAGIGLGLVISNQLARMLSPNQSSGLIVKSIYSQGSTFTFLLAEQTPTVLSNIVSNPDQKDENTNPFDEVITNNNNHHHLNIKELEENLSDSDISENQPMKFKIHIISEIEENPQKCNDFVHTPRLSFLKSFKSDNNGNEEFQNKLPSTANQVMIPLENKLHYKYSLLEEKTSTIKQDTCKCPIILVVDDDGFNQMAIQTLLEKFGFSCTLAYNGLLAIETILKREKNPCCKFCNPYQIIFMDCNMPVMDGYEATIKLKEMMKKKDIRQSRIIGCTSYSTKEKLDECLKCGMDDFISKPLSNKKLLEIFKYSKLKYLESQQQSI